MGRITAPSYVEEVTLSAVVTRADGRVEDLGEVAYYHKSRVRRLLHRLKRSNV